MPGLGDKKVKRLYQALQEPFRAVKQKVNRNDSSSSSATSSSSSNSGNNGSYNGDFSGSGTGNISEGITLSGTKSNIISSTSSNSIGMAESIAAPSVERSNDENSAVIVQSGDSSRSLTSRGDSTT